MTAPLAPLALEVEAPKRLMAFPNWVYLLREFEALYRRGSAGGSKPIRTHRKRVREGISQVFDTNPVVMPRGPIYSEKMILGFVLFAPRTTYPQHSHAEIEESDISVAGDWSENEVAVHAPGSLILNRPGDEHRITTADLDPCLLAYAWLGPESKLSSPGMKLSATRKARIEAGI
ncbi:dimethylsulfonioproprionate lyase family protein [Roseobacter sp. HKCC-CH-9324]|uniref:dimethylsulfonioproprionate lyase family protein n=1 Tax=unclassified Roseobacter TaxID=196798 RepID=UPI004040AADB